MRGPLRLVVLAVAGLASGGSIAQMDPLLRQQLTGFEKIGPNEYRRVVTPTVASTGTRAIVASNGGALVSDAVTLAGKGGPLAVTATAQVARGTALVGSALVLKALPVVGTGLLVWDLWEALRVTPKGDGLGLLHDPGVSQVLQPSELWNGVGVASGCGAQTFGSSSAAHSCSTSYQIALVISNVTGLGVGTESGTRIVTMVENSPTSHTWTTQWWMTTCNSGTGACGGSVKQANITTTHSKTVSDIPTCPASIDPLDPALSIPAGEAPDADGKCRQARYHHSPISPEGAAALPGTANIPGSLIPDVVRDVLERGVGLLPDSRGSQGPATQPGQPTTTTTTNPDNSVTTKTQTPTYNYNYGGDTITVTTTTTTVTNNGGDITTEITEDGGSPAGEEIITCGLPNTPKGKIDETGTPESQDALPDPVASLEPLGGVPAPVDSAWSWSFSLPAGCSAISLGQFAGRAISFDLCPYQPVVHDIMTVLWLMSTVILCAGMVLRTFQGA